MSKRTTSIFHALSQSDVVKLIVAHALIFVLLEFIRISLLISNDSTDFYYQFILYKLQLPSSFKECIYQPWSLITHLFSELSFLHLLSNMIWLWIFSFVIEDLLGTYRIIPIYITGGVISAIFLLTFYTIKPESQMSPYFASSTGAVWAVVVATLAYKPHYQFSKLFGFSIPIWIYGLVFFALNFLFIKNNWMAWGVYLLGATLVGLSYPKILSQYFLQCTIHLRKWSSYFKSDKNFIEKKRNHTIDELLDKINKNGSASLTQKERKELEELSKNV